MNKQEVTASGNCSLAAGRDINIILKELVELYRTDYRKLLEERLEEVDNIINGLFPNRVSSPRTKDKNAYFSSKRMISSLGLLGIPIDVSLQILESVIPEFEKISQHKDALEASDIRRCVANALMQYNNPNYSSQKIQIWTDKYIRRYGKPDQRIEVIFQNGEKDNLSIDFLRNFLIPDLINIVLSQTKYEDFKKWITESEIRRMAREIFDAVSSLSIYRIHYDSLLQLSKELALQPPHPWLVPKAFDFEAVKYNFYKARKHRTRIKEFDLEENTAIVLYSARECVHHSCAGILSYYGIFIGCGDYAALNSLISILKKISNNSRQLIEHYSKISIFQRDIDKNGLSVATLLHCLDRVKRSFNISPHANLTAIAQFLKYVNELYDYMSKFIEKYIYINEVKLEDIENINKDNFNCCALKAIELFPKCSIQQVKGDHIWLTQEIGSPFEHITSIVLLLLSYSKDKGHEIQINLLKRFLSRQEIGSNAFLIISNRKIEKEDKQELLALQKKGIYGAILNLSQVISIVTNSNPIGAIKKMIKT